MIERLKKFFREDVSEIVGAYFDGEKIFIVRLTESFETAEVDADDADIESLAEKISRVCTRRGWKTSLVGFCLREGDAVINQTEIKNLPAKEIPAFVKSWAMAQSGKDAAFSFSQVGEELWMETLPRAKVEEYSAAFKKFNLNLRGLSVMPADMLTEIAPFDGAKFISNVLRERKAPNLLSARGSEWSWKKLSLATAAIFFIVMFVGSMKLLFDYHEASANLDAAKNSLEDLREEVALKENLDADIDELHRLNKLAAQIEVKQNFNLLIKLGKIAGDDVRLTKIRAEENFLELEGIADEPDAVKSYLSRVKNSVAPSAQLENSTENDYGEIVFLIRAKL